MNRTALNPSGIAAYRRRRIRLAVHFAGAPASVACSHEREIFTGSKIAVDEHDVARVARRGEITATKVYQP